MTADRPTRDDDSGFLARWSRQKSAARTGEAEAALPETGEPIEAPTEPAAADAANGATPKTEEDLLEELGLPDPESLKAGDDFSGFMNQAVPASLRRRALRKLWLTDPTLANLDALVDYGEDFTDAATVIEGMQTLYQVGRGFLTDDDLAAGEVAAGEVTEGDATEHADDQTARQTSDQTS
ncbi:MAG: DUF3306 domain-containing protein, partial [Pseudomonadota bacterium]